MSEVAGLFLEALRLDRQPLPEVERRAREALEGGCGGFVLFGGEATEMACLTRRLRAETARPLWFAADLERGAGQQFSGAPALPPPAALAAHADPERAARRAGALTAAHARLLGVNWVLAPVLDLDLEPENPIIGTRSFGADPQEVARLGRAWIDGCQSAGVAACAKHFPGHGRTRADSHAALPEVTASRKEMQADLEPFRRTAPEVASVMTAHVAYPALDGPAPATLSPGILRRLLRGDLGFGGLVVSDAMNMAGFREGPAPADEAGRACAALRAGCDLLLYPESLESTAAGLEEAVSSDPVLAARAREALERSRRWLDRFAPEAPAAGEAHDREDEGIAPRVRTALERDRAEAEELALECLRWTEAGTGEAAHPSGDLGPGHPALRLRPEQTTRLVAIDDDRERPGAPRLGEELSTTLESLGWRTTRRPDGTVAGPARAIDAGQRLVLLRSTPQAWKGRAGLLPGELRRVSDALAAGVPTLLLVFGGPRLLDPLGASGLVAWAGEGVMERAAARWLDRVAHHGATGPRP